MDPNALVTTETFIAILQAAGLTNARCAAVFQALLLRDEILLAESRENIANASVAQAQSEAATELAAAAEAKIEAQEALDTFMKSRL